MNIFDSGEYFIDSFEPHDEDFVWCVTNGPGCNEGEFTTLLIPAVVVENPAPFVDIASYSA